MKRIGVVKIFGFLSTIKKGRLDKHPDVLLTEKFTNGNRKSFSFFEKQILT